MKAQRYGNEILKFDDSCSVSRTGYGDFFLLGKIVGGKFQNFKNKKIVKRQVSYVRPFELPDALLSNDFQGSCRHCGTPVGQQVAGVRCPNCGELYSFREWFFAACGTNII
jgi:hypothetical protein